MEPCTIPSSPNWFLCSVSDGNANGLYAFGSKTDVWVYDTGPSSLESKKNDTGSSKTSESEAKFNFICCYYGHSYDNEKITGVSLHPDSQQWVCCSADNYVVNIWDIRSKVTMQSHSEHKVSLLSVVE